MNKQFFDILNNLEVDFNYRYIQPPQIAYFVTTLDEFGNPNSTPVTLGTCNSANLPRGGKPAEFYLSFALRSKATNDVDDINRPRDGFINLLNSDEVVISYIGKDIMRESIIANLPLPRGISELDIAGLHTFPSTNVLVPSIKECPINIECKVMNRIQLGEYYMLYVCKAVGISVDNALLEKDKDGLGVFHINPLFEVNITNTKSGNTRLNYGEMDYKKISVPGDDFGSMGDWVGTFEHFIDSEFKRGKISKTEKEEIITLASHFKKDRSNKELKYKLTELIKKAVG
jgi:flavin reductase (DIM6/NTAB) family NADH-FMN oxidoreductase RutF